MSESDRAAITALIAQSAAGWNRSSGEAFAAAFAEDSDYVHVNGGLLKGRKANADQHQKLFDSLFSGTKLAVHIRSIRFLRPDVALVHTSSRTSRDGVPEPPADPAEQTNVQSWVFTKNDGSWQVESFQNTSAK